MPLDSQFNETGDDFEKQPGEPSPPLGKNQKIAVASLSVFAVFIIILWFAQLRANIYGPFNGPANSSQLAQSGQDEAAKMAALKTKDTDGDGLNDYDELYVYKTSPYLADTDSDGYKDGEEIKKGFDPNCPQGRTCAGNLLDNSAGSAPAAADSALNGSLNQSGGANSGAQAGSSADLNAGQLDALKNMDAASLRALLLQNGMDKATLDKISDADLLKSFQETLSGQ